MKQKTKSRLTVVLVLVIISTIFAAIWIIRQKRAQRARQADYASQLASFNQFIRPGMSRKQVEDSFRERKIEFGHMCCVQPAELASRRSWDDLVWIGAEDAPWFCSRHNIYIAFQFADHNSRERHGESDGLDTLRAVSIYGRLEGCL